MHKRLFDHHHDPCVESYNRLRKEFWGGGLLRAPENEEDEKKVKLEPNHGRQATHKQCTLRGGPEGKEIRIETLVRRKPLGK